MDHAFIARPDAMPDWPWRGPDWTIAPCERIGLITGLLQHLAGSMTPGERITWTDADAIREALRLCREQAAEDRAKAMEGMQ